MESPAQKQALIEKAFSEAVLAKGGLTVLTEVLAGVETIGAWQHYPDGDVYDPASHAQWYYHCHPAQEGSTEHGHFHCFIRPQGPAGPIHHLAAIGVDAGGKLLRIFTVNQWVIGDDWADAQATIALLDRFDMQMPRPSYLVNRWLTAILIAFRPQIAELIAERDRVLGAHRPPAGIAARQDRALEVTSQMLIA